MERSRDESFLESLSGRSGVCVKEDDMRCHAVSLRGARWAMFLVPLVLVLVPACAEVSVNVCDRGGGIVTLGQGPTGCNPMAWENQSAAGFYDTTQSPPAQLPQDTTKVCVAGSTKCKPIPGRCMSGPCKTYWTPTSDPNDSANNGVCVCDCP